MSDIEQKDAGAIADAWQSLRRHTPARIAPGHAGVSLPTREVLAFSQAHALARDAVHAALDVPRLRTALKGLGLAISTVQSAAPSRAAYLARPDWGRRLHPDSELPEASEAGGVVLLVADGLSATAVQQHAPPLLEALLPKLSALDVGPLIIAEQARVGLSDAIGERLQARMVINLIGERPGLSAPDSLGAYLTFSPRPGCSDAQRNCVSNIRPQGLGFEEAASEIARLTHSALRHGCSGVALAAKAGAVDALPR